MNSKTPNIFEQIAELLSSEKMLSIDEKIRFLALVREDAELCWRQ